MAIEEVTAKLGKDEKSEDGKTVIREAPGVTVEYDFGDDLDDAADRFGRETVYERFKAAARVDLQAVMRTLLARKVSEDAAVVPPEVAADIQAYTTNWKPGVRAQGKTTLEKASDLWGKLSDSEREELLRRVKAA